MLSRHAEGMFWIGRYVERAAGIGRMLDVAYNAQLESATRAPVDVWRDLLDVLYLREAFTERHGGTVSTEAITAFLVLDRDNDSSVAASITRARTNVMNVRDIVPIELLESINQFHDGIRDPALQPLAAASPHQVYAMVTRFARGVSGAVWESMPRGDGFRFLTIGRFLERAEMTCRVIGVNRAVTVHDVPTWMSALRSLSGFHAFISTYGALASVDQVVNFLLASPEFPFSVRFCVDSARSQAAAIEGATGWTSPRLLGRLQSDLVYAEIPAAADPALVDFVARLERGLREIGGAVHHDLYRFGGDPTLHTFEAL